MGAPATCAACNGPADPLRDPVRIVGGRFAHTCRACAGAQPTEAAHRVQCPCGARVGPGAARPRVIDDRVELCCPACDQPVGRPAGAGATKPDGAAPGGDRADTTGTGELPAVTAIDVDSSRRRTRLPPRVVLGAVAAVAALALTGFALAPSWLGSKAPPAMATPVLQQAPASPPVVLSVEGDLTLLDDPAEAEILPEPMAAELDSYDESIDEPVIVGDWTHPVIAAEETLPNRGSRRFGAVREGRPEGLCGGGHCGVDLSGPRGTPIVAVYDGVVVRVERRSERRSGMYVKIRHPGDVYTSYMHLDDIRPDLRVGNRVRGGYFLGSLGVTGIQASAPHLHFEIEVWRDGRHRHIDPEPLLERSIVLDVLDLAIPLDLVAEPLTR